MDPRGNREKRAVQCHLFRADVTGRIHQLRSGSVRNFGCGEGVTCDLSILPKNEKSIAKKRELGKILLSVCIVSHNRGSLFKGEKKWYLPMNFVW